MSDQYLPLPYQGGTPGADANAYVLFDSTQLDPPSRSPAIDYRRYLLTLKNSQPGTLNLYASKDGGKSWLWFASYSVAATPTVGAYQLGFPLPPGLAFRAEWVNGGAAQATWLVAQALDDGSAPARGTSDANGASSDVTTVQFGALALGQKTSALSISVVESTDSLVKKAASLRGAIRGETLPITVNKISKTFTVPASWLGKHVRLTAEGGNVYYQISLTGTAADADGAARAQESGSPIALTPSAGAKDAGVIFASQYEDIPFPANAVTVAFQGSADAMVLRTHPAET